MSRHSRLMTVPMAMVTSMALTSSSAAEPEAEPVACQLSPRAYESRLEEIGELFAASDLTRELDDGYEFRFPGDEVWATRLLELIHAERQCCQFITFELFFEPQRGAIWLRARGPEEAKAFLSALLSD